MSIREREQNPAVGTTVRLRLWVFASNDLADPESIDGVQLYFLDPSEITATNPDGRVLVAEIDAGDVTREDTGKYYVDVELALPTYVRGEYIDAWAVTYSEGGESAYTYQYFTVYPQLWVTSPGPVLYDFSFSLYPSRLIKGEIKNLIISIKPNVPRATDLERYYYDLAVLSDITVTITQRCGQCLPQEEDLRVVVEDAEVDYKSRCQAFYRLDTTELECGIYDLQAKLEYGGNTYHSEKMPFQIYS